MAPARGSSIGVRTNTIQGVKQKEVGDPLAAHRRYSRKNIPIEDPEEFMIGIPPNARLFLALGSRTFLAKRLNRNIDRCSFAISCPNTWRIRDLDRYIYIKFNFQYYT